MNGISEILKNHPLVIVKLGAAGDDYGFIPEHIRRNTILVSLDARSQGADRARKDFLRQIPVRDVVAPRAAPCVFIERAWWGCSSLLETKAQLVEKYGQQSFCKERSRSEVSPITVKDVLSANRLEGFDVLVTDLEGSDLGIIASCEPMLGGATLVQAELRFEPFYEGEPPLHDALAYMARNGFQLIGIKPEFWKPVSKRRGSFSDGVVVWADCLFFRAAAADVQESNADSNVVLLTKSIVLLSLFGKKSLAAHLYERNLERLNGPLRRDLESVLRPDSALWRLRRSLRELRTHAARIRHYARFVLRTRRWSWAEASGSYFDFGHVARPEDNL